MADFSTFTWEARSVTEIEPSNGILAYAPVSTSKFNAAIRLDFEIVSIFLSFNQVINMSCHFDLLYHHIIRRLDKLTQVVRLLQQFHLIRRIASEVLHRISKCICCFNQSWIRCFGPHFVSTEIMVLCLQRYDNGHTNYIPRGKRDNGDLAHSARGRANLERHFVRARKLAEQAIESTDRSTGEKCIHCGVRRSLSPACLPSVAFLIYLIICRPKTYPEKEESRRINRTSSFI